MVEYCEHVGGRAGAKAGRFKGLPCDEIVCDGADSFAWMEKEVDQRERNAGFLAVRGESTRDGQIGQGIAA